MATTRLAVYDINDFILNGTPAGALMGWTGGGVRPIVPLQQQPEFNAENADFPYIVYTWRTSPNLDTWWANTDEVNYVIWGKTIETIAPVATAIVDSCRALDQSASDLNDYLRTKDQVDFDFYYVRVVGSFSPEPTGQEGGRIGWLITLRTMYSPLAGKHVQ